MSESETPKNESKKKMSFPRRVLFFLKFLEIRLRFVAVLVITALAVGYWDHIQNYYERWQREHGKAPAAVHESAPISDETEYFCGMHPFVVRDRQGKCPICGMDLTPRKKGAPMELPEGVLARVQASPERILQAGVEVEPVLYRMLTRTTRSYGVIEVDEAKLARISARFPGRIDELLVNTTGATVKKGEALARIYSPKYLAASEEYVRALGGQRGLGDAKPEEQARASQLVDAAKRRLRLAGFTEDQLEAVARGGGVKDSVTLYSPLSGTVIEKAALLGETVEEGTALYTIADLSTLWVQVQVTEADMAAVKKDMPVEITTVAYPGQIFFGNVDLVYPMLDAESRTVKVRVTVTNPEGRLKPGMYVNAVLRSPLGVFEPANAADSGPKAKAGTASPITTEQAEADKLVAGLPEGGEYYECAMHPNVRSKAAGDCPLCRMTLDKKIKGGGSGSATPTTEQADADKLLAGLPDGGEYYECAMHANVRSDKPGECPLCHMTLDKKKKEGGSGLALPTTEQADADKFLAGLPQGAEYYECAMHANVRSDKPGECPLCHMFLDKSTKTTVEAGQPIAEVGSTEQWVTGYACEMHPNELSDKPGVCLTCNCGMKMKEWRVERVLSIPEVSVVDTGDRKVVYVEDAPGVYDAHTVTLGSRSGAYYPVLDGLTLGQKVVTRGSFLIDAEARLNPAIVHTAPAAAPADTAGAHAGHQHGS